MKDINMRVIHKILVLILKNLLVFLGGGVLGLAAVLIFAEQLLRSAIPKDVGLGIIALAPVMLLLYAVMFGVSGGVLAVIIYNVARFARNRNAARQKIPAK